MSRDEWKIVLSKASINMTDEICAYINHNVNPPKENRCW